MTISFRDFVFVGIVLTPVLRHVFARAFLSRFEFAESVSLRSVYTSTFLRSGEGVDICLLEGVH